MYSRTEKYHGRRAQRFSIRKYSFGAASVLLGTALLLGANAVKADETNVATTKAPEITNSDKQKPDSAITTPVVEELPELKIDAVKADEKPEVKDDAKTEATPVAEKEVTDKVEKEKSDKEQADKKEADKEKTDKETAEKTETVKPKDEVKTVLTQLTSEAEVMATVASNFSDKEVKDVEAKQKLSAAIAAVKLEAVAAKGLLYSNDSTEEQLTAQVNRISSAIEAVYAEMKRAGHAGKVEAVLGATDAKDQTITGKGVIRNGNAVVTVNNAYVTMNADNTAPKAWGIDVVFDTSQAQNGDTTTIEMKNLTGFGDSFKPGTKITAADGTVIGEVVSKATTNSAGNRNGKAPFWAQRNQDGMTYEERLAEQPAIPNEVGTTTYTIRWNDKAKNYAVTTFYEENLTAIDYYAPDISKDTEYTAAISVNGQQILEHKYTHKASKSAAQKQNTSATIMGDNILGYKGSERVRKSDAVVINTDSDVRYGKGSKFTITLPNDDFTYFKTIDGSKNTATNTNKADSITYRPAGRWNNVQANANNVWILNDGRDTNFTLKATVKSPTELEIEVINGAIQEDSIVSIGLDKLGVEKAKTNRTFSDEYSKFIYDEAGRLKDGSVVGDTDKTAATLTVSGGTPLNGGEENITTKVANGWKVEVGAGGNSQFETGAVTITLVNIETGEEIAYEPTSYDGFAKPNEDGSYETKNILGKKYDVSNEIPDLTKTINGIEYIRVDVPAKGTTGTVNIGPNRASAIYSSEELQANGVNPNAFVNNVVYYYVKKTKVEEVNRTIKYVYADDVKDLAGQQVFEPTNQTVSYTGTIQVNAKNEAEVDANRKPIYINWVGNGDTTLPEVTVPQKEGYIASVEKVPVQATTATDEDYEYVVTYTAIQKARTTFVYQDKDGNVKQVEGNTPITETGKGGDKLTKAEEVANRVKEAQNKGYEVVSNNYPTDGVFDKDVDTDQEFTVTLKERVVPVTPDQPKTPGTPVDPNNPDGPKYPAGLEEKDLNKTVTRTITYVYADGTPVLNEDGTPKVVTQEAKFTREAKVNLVTGEVTYGDWSDAQDLAEVKSPEIAKHTVDKATVATVQVTNASENINEVVTYTPIQKATTTFVYQDKEGNVKQVEGNEPISETGTNGDKLTKAEVIAAKIKEAQNKGYELVSNTYPTDGVFDKDVDTDQEFTVTLKERVVPVTPDQPKTPGTPVDPNNPDGPKYPAGLEEKDLNKTVTRTITYVYEDGTPVLNEDGTPKTVTQEAKFTCEAKVNLVTGEVTYGDWTPEQDLVEVKSPVVKGFVADKATVPTTKVTADSKDATEVVTYKPLGSWVPNIPGQPTNPIKYPNDPTDPTKPGTEKPKAPYVPGFTPKDKDGNPLKPVNPNNPEEGYEVPNLPTDPSQDTPINYVANKANLVVKYVDEKGKDLLPAETTEGKVGDEYATTGKVITGYVLERVEGEAKGKIGKDGSTVTYVYKPLGSWIPNIPGQPTNPIKYPNDPADPTKPGTDTPTVPYVEGYTPKDGNGQPLKPVDPNDPTKGYIVPNIPTDPGQDTVINYEANDANLVVKYVDENGKELRPTETTKGKVGDEYTTEGKVIDGYVLVRVEGEAKGKIGKDGSTVTYVYKPLGSWIPNIPGQPTNPIKYPNDPTDPTKPGSDKPVLPYVPGHTPVDGNGQPLKPVDPNDPTKGYEVPDIPTNPGEDTPINYIPNSPKPNPTPYPGPTPAPTPKPDPKPEPAPVPSTPETPEQPVAPVQPEQPTTPNQPAVPTPAETSVPTDSATQPATPKYVDGQKELPNTGTEANASLAALGLLGALSGFGLLARKKKED